MSLDQHTLTEAIKAEALRLGFHLVGVTTPQPPESYSIYTDWLQAGRHGEMAYLDSQRSRQRRSDPRQILPECRSILALAVPYHPPAAPAPEPGARPHGKVAAYAWGADYHDILPERLKALVTYIEDRVGEPVPNRWYTDTGPILERDLAQRAGLGWIGKNSCLIHPQAGSYFLLAEILLGIELEVDTPFASDHCGACTRCLEACPTDCILPNRTIDARRCISYLTIELKGPIPTELRPQMGEWVFGCDVCQQVCPWNIRFAAAPEEPALPPRPAVPAPDLLEELDLLDPQAFNRKFKGSPVKRTKRRGYLRNVTVTLGNQRDPRSVSSLIRALSDPEPLVRGHAAWALGQIGGEAARSGLEAVLEREADSEVRQEISQALDRLTDL